VVRLTIRKSTIPLKRVPVAEFRAIRDPTERSGSRRSLVNP
jgi:hypothetical protein